MGLKGDIDEIERIWKSSPWRVKAYLALSLFLATSSLASLSDTVAHWKGFILDALHFYRSTITEPLVDLLTSLLHVNFSREYIEVASIWLIYFFVNVRITHYKTTSWFTLHQRRGRNLAFAFLITLLFAQIIFLLYYFWCQPIPSDSYSLIYLYAFLAISETQNQKGAARLLVGIWWFSPALLLGVAAAIQLGLAK